MADVAILNRAGAQERGLTRSDIIIGVLLLVVMLTGGYFRFVGLNWDDFTHLHPDERFLTDVASSLGGGIRSSLSGQVEQQAQIDRCLARYPDTGGVGGYFDAECSTLNPHNVGKGLYVYGTLPLFAARAAGDLMVSLTGDTSLNTYNGVHLVWRALSALSDMATILVIFFIGLHLHGRWVGILAAALYASSVLMIQLSHFGTVDAMANFFAALSLLFALSVQLRNQLADYALFGLAAGAALACRVNLAPVVGLLVLAAMLRFLPVLDMRLAGTERWRILGQIAGGSGPGRAADLPDLPHLQSVYVHGAGLLRPDAESTMVCQHSRGAGAGERGCGDSPELSVGRAHTLPLRTAKYGAVGHGRGAGAGRAGRHSLVHLALDSRAGRGAAQSAAGRLVPGLFWLAGPQLGGDHALLSAGLPGLRADGSLAAGRSWSGEHARGRCGGHWLTGCWRW